MVSTSFVAAPDLSVNDDAYRPRSVGSPSILSVSADQILLDVENSAKQFGQTQSFATFRNASKLSSLTTTSLHQQPDSPILQVNVEPQISHRSFLAISLTIRRMKAAIYLPTLGASDDRSYRRHNIHHTYLQRKQLTYPTKTNWKQPFPTGIRK